MSRKWSDLTAEEQQQIKLAQEAMEQAARMPEEERQGLFDTGIFNGIVRGYLITTLQRGGFSDDTISECLTDLDDVFDTTSAAEAMAAWNRW